MLFQDDLGVENGGQNRAKIEPGAFQDALAARLPLGVILGSKMEAKLKSKSCLGAFQDALGAGLPLEAILASMLVHFWTSGTPKNRALAVARCYFCRK